MENNFHLKAYIDFLVSHVDFKKSLKIVADCSNGPATLVIHELANKIKGKVNFTIINDELHPDFPAHGADPTEASALDDARNTIKHEQANLGVVFDGDADRAVFLDETGKHIPSHVIAALMIDNIPGVHIADALVYEALIHTNPALKDRILPSRVGRYYINLAMHEHSAVMGAEFSGHYYFSDFWNADSAVLTMIKVANLLSTKKGNVSASLESYSHHHIGAGKIGVSESFESIKEKVRAYVSTKAVTRTSDLDGLTVDFGETWINVRPSNTEPIIRITAGANSKEEMTALVEEYKKALS